MIRNLPSLILVYPGADLQEREVYDLFGIRFNGHPRLRRIFLWEGFNGHPMRKDWKEAYYEEDHKPFKSRWPVGNYKWAEDRSALGRQCQLSPTAGIPTPSQPAPPPVPIIHEPPAGEEDRIKTDRIIVNMGPQHPSTHGVFRMIVALDGETIVGLEPEWAICIAITRRSASATPGWATSPSPTASTISPACPTTSAMCWQSRS